MALAFDYINDLNTGQTPFISHEKDSSLHNYYIANELAMDKSAIALLGEYDDVVFSSEDRHLTTRSVSKIGIKNFPGIGGIGFYKDFYTNESLIVAPIHTEPEEYEAPVLKVAEIVNGKLHIVVEPPGDLAYTCYRVIVKQGYFAFEYIMYKTDYYMDIPYVKGDFVVYCMGYDEEMGTISEYSNELNLTVATGNDNWGPTSLDTSSVENRLLAIEKEIANYDDEEITEAVAEVITSV